MSSISSWVKRSPERQHRITFYLAKYPFKDWQIPLPFPCKDLLLILTQRRKGTKLSILLLPFCQCKSCTLREPVQKKGKDLDLSNLLVHRHQNSLFISAMDFKTTTFVSFSPGYIRIIISHLALLALVFTSWKTSSFSPQSCLWTTSSLREPGYHLKLDLAQNLHTLLSMRQVGMSQPCKKSRLFKRYWGLQNVQLKSRLWISLFACGSRIKIKIMSTETTETSGNLSCRFTRQQKSHILSEHRGVHRITNYPDITELQIWIRIKISIL